MLFKEGVAWEGWQGPRVCSGVCEDAVPQFWEGLGDGDSAIINPINSPSFCIRHADLEATPRGTGWAQEARDSSGLVLKSYLSGNPQPRANREGFLLGHVPTLQRQRECFSFCMNIQ